MADAVIPYAVLALLIPHLTWSMIITLIVVGIKWDTPTDMLHHLYIGSRNDTGCSALGCLHGSC